MKELLILSVVGLANTGDIENNTALVQKLYSEFAGYNITNKIIDANSQNYESQYESNIVTVNGKKIITLFIGPDGKEALTELDSSKKLDIVNSFNSLIIHQYYDNIPHLHIDHLFIPQAILGLHEKELKSIQSKTRSLAMPSVNPSLKELQQTYEEWEIEDKPSLKDKYIIVTLPGDAPDSNGIQHYFTQKSAEELFNSLYSFWQNGKQDYTVIVQSTPRTGKYNIDTGAIECDHKYKKGENPDKAIDKISKCFLDRLKETNIPYRFFNFAIEQLEIDGKSQNIKHSVFNQLLYLSSQPGNYSIIGGETITGIGKMTLYVDNKHLLVFLPDSMNTDHKNIVMEAADNQKLLSILIKPNETLYPTGPTIKRLEDDASKAAHDIAQGYQKKFLYY